MKFFSEPKEVKDDVIRNLTFEHHSWKRELISMNKPFFSIHSDFQISLLKDISGPALKLYLFLGLNSRYDSGESWYSAPQLSEYFQKDQRTINNWFKELEELGLIERKQTGFKRAANTFLKPYGIMILEDDTFNYQGLKSIKTLVYNLKTREEPLHSALMLTDLYEDFTFVLITKKDNLFYCYTFLNFDYQDIKELKFLLHTLNLNLDYYDITKSLYEKNKFKPQYLYSNVLDYLEENY